MLQQATYNQLFTLPASSIKNFFHTLPGREPLLSALSKLFHLCVLRHLGVHANVYSKKLMRAHALSAVSFLVCGRKSWSVEAKTIFRWINLDTLCCPSPGESHGHRELPEPGSHFALGRTVATQHGIQFPRWAAARQAQGLG